MSKKSKSWFLEAHESGPQIITDSDGNEIARTAGITNDCDEDLEVDGYADDKANALLIASVPDLLKAAKKVVKCWADGEQDGDAQINLEEAIAKAEGDL